MNVACLTPFSQGGKMTTENLHILQYTIMLQQYSYSRQIFFASPLQIGSIGNGGAAPIISTMLFCCTDRNRSTQIFQQFKGVTSVQKGFNSPIKLGKKEKGGMEQTTFSKGNNSRAKKKLPKTCFCVQTKDLLSKLATENGKLQLLSGSEIYRYRSTIGNLFSSFFSIGTRFFLLIDFAKIDDHCDPRDPVHRSVSW